MSETVFLSASRINLVEGHLFAQLLSCPVAAAESEGPSARMARLPGLRSEASSRGRRRRPSRPLTFARLAECPALAAPLSPGNPSPIVGALVGSGNAAFSLFALTAE